MNDLALRRRPLPALISALLLLAPTSTAQAPAGSHSPRAPRSFEWRALGAMPGAGPSVIQFADTPADPDRVYAATSAGVLASSDRGQTWELRSTYAAAYWGFGYLSVSSLDANLLLLTPLGDGIWRSSDGGTTWERPPGAPPAAAFPWYPVFAPSDPGTAYATTEDGVWRSLDGGQHFEQVLSGLIAAGGYGWETVVDPADAQHAYHLTWYLGVYETADAGAHWVQKPLPAGAQQALSFAIDPNDGDRLALGVHGTVYLSADGGDSWIATTNGLPPVYVDEVAFDAADPNRIYAGIRMRGLAISADGGASWSVSADPGLDRSGGSPLAILASDSSAGLVLVGAQGGVFRSTDSGLTFARSNGGLASLAAVDDLAVDPFDATHLVAKTGGSAYVSSDSGASWTEASGFQNGYCVSLSADRAVLGRYYAGGFDGAFWRSDDGGSSFYASFSSAAHWFAKTCAHPTIGGRVYATGNGLWRSDDGGASFVSDGVPLSWSWGFAISAVDPLVMYCCGSTAMYRSDDGGASWLAADVQPGGIVRDVIPDPLVAGRAYAAAPLAGFYRTDDGGRTWTEMAVALEHADTGLVSPLDPGLVLASDFLRPKAWASDDLGASAALHAVGLTTSVTRFAGAPGVVYAATRGSGVLALW